MSKLPPAKCPACHSVAVFAHNHKLTCYDCGSIFKNGVRVKKPKCTVRTLHQVSAGTHHTGQLPALHVLDCDYS